MRRIVLIAATVSATVGGTGWLSAQSTQGYSRLCQDFTIEPNTQILACTNLSSNPFAVWHALMLRAAAYLRVNQVENARTDYTRALQHIRTTNNFYSKATWYASLCWTYAVLNLELDEALALCDEGIKLQPRNGPALNSRGLVLLRMGQFAQALANYDQALERPLSERIADYIDNRSHYALFGRGIAKLRLAMSREEMPT
jgi:tetratricopeptide (TPR) repeat protein